MGNRNAAANCALDGLHLEGITDLSSDDAISYYYESKLQYPKPSTKVCVPCILLLNRSA